MVFRWDWLTNIEYRTMDHTVGLKTPTIAGGLFSIGKFLFIRGQILGIMTIDIAIDELGKVALFGAQR